MDLNMSFDDDFEKIKNKIKFEQVAKVIKEDPKNWSNRLEDIGFFWEDDGYDDQEELEEKLAKPENINQEFLVGYFDGHISFTEAVLKTFLEERESDNPNYPLFRKYFKSGNEQLRQLLLYGLSKTATDIDLLSDLTYFHEYRNILGELISLYLKACEDEQDVDKFEEIVMDFYYATKPDGYDALYELNEKLKQDNIKRETVKKLIDKVQSEPEDVEF